MRTLYPTPGDSRPGATLSTLLAVLLSAALGTLVSQPVHAAGAGQRPAESLAPSAVRMLRLAERYESAVREMLPVLERQADAATLWTALYDARRSVVELDRILANAAIFSASNRDREQLRERTARSHLRLALFETHGRPDLCQRDAMPVGACRFSCSAIARHRKTLDQYGIPRLPIHR